MVLLLCHKKFNITLTRSLNNQLITGTDLCDLYKVCYDSSALLGYGLAEHHKLDPLGDTVKKHDEALQDGVIHRAAVSYEAVIVLELST